MKLEKPEKAFEPVVILFDDNVLTLETPDEVAALLEALHVATLTSTTLATSMRAIDIENIRKIERNILLMMDPDREG